MSFPQTKLYTEEDYYSLPEEEGAELIQTMDILEY